MQRFKELLVCLDRTPRDKAVLAMAGAISTAAASRTVHVWCAPRRSDLPEDLLAKHPDLREAPEAIETAIRGEVEAEFRGRGEVRVTCRTDDRSRMYDILRYARDSDIDLILVGRGAVPASGGRADATLGRRLALKTACSVMVVPEDAAGPPHRLLVPFRNSECSANALDVAAAFARAYAPASLVCHYVYPVHPGYMRTGCTLEEYVAALERQGAKEFEQIAQAVNLKGVDVSTVYSPDQHDDPASVIAQTAVEQKADMIVIGARGRTGPAGVLLGRVTEDLMTCSTVPVLAVKKKGERIGLLEAILTAGA